MCYDIFIHVYIFVDIVHVKKKLIVKLEDDMMFSMCYSFDLY